MKILMQRKLDDKMIQLFFPQDFGANGGKLSPEWRVVKRNGRTVVVR